MARGRNEKRFNNPEAVKYMMLPIEDEAQIQPPLAAGMTAVWCLP